MSLLIDKLKSFEYYKNKLPMYLQASDGFLSHFRIWYDLLAGQNRNGVVNVCDDILDLLNIFDSNFLTKIAAQSGSNVSASHKYGTKSDLLDKIASFFGVTRKFSCSYVESGATHTYELDLDNEELLLLIKSQVLKSSYDGSYQLYKDFYNDMGLNMLLLTKAGYPATVDMILAKINGAVYGEAGYYTNNTIHMFKSGLLRVQSLGITYNCTVTDLTSFLIWDDSAATPKTWDSATWGL